MRRVRGFDDQILDALKSGDPEIEYEAVKAAGNWELNSAWSHIIGLVQDPATAKHLLLAAIDAVACIRPREAGAILLALADSDDEEMPRQPRKPSPSRKEVLAKSTTTRIPTTGSIELQTWFQEDCKLRYRI
jgi:hypothetical protein